MPTTQSAKLPTWAVRCALAPTPRTRLLQIEYVLRCQDLLLSLPAAASRDQCVAILDSYRHELWEQSYTPRRTLRYSPPSRLPQQQEQQAQAALPANLEDLF